MWLSCNFFQTMKMKLTQAGVTGYSVTGSNSNKWRDIYIRIYIYISIYYLGGLSHTSHCHIVPLLSVFVQYPTTVVYSCSTAFSLALPAVRYYAPGSTSY